MTLYAPDGLFMVLLEHFDHLTSAIDCKGDDGTLSLTFNSPQSYEYALQAWGFVNANDDGKFLLIANHQGCGPDDERQAYIINSIREDGVSLTTYLAAQPAPWSDIGGTYDLDFGHVMAYRHGPERRHWLDKLKGNIDITKEKDFDLSIGHPDDVQTLWHDDKQELFETHHWKPRIATILVNPKGFNATLELKAKVTKNQKIGGWFSKDKSSTDSIEQEKELAEAPVPDFGIDIPGVLKLGAILSYSIGYATFFMGSASIVFGVTASLPDDATIMVDLLDRDQSYSYGFDGELVPIFDVTELTATVQFAVFTQAKLAFGIEIPHLDKQDIELVLKIPKLSYTVSAGYGKLGLGPLVEKDYPAYLSVLIEESGFCSGDVRASKTGAKVIRAASIELWFEVVARFGKGWIKKKGVEALYSKKLLNFTKTLPEECVEIDIPGLSVAPTESLSGLLPFQTGLISDDTADDAADSHD
ncbi:MAG: hypothetical protein ASARMPRED_007222 [Alectoria sarmentosa]|nr:MAG: hypothetical protein ASARMPRED_007222 [Alectoria sarmentosa]